MSESQNQNNVLCSVYRPFPRFHLLLVFTR